MANASFVLLVVLALGSRFADLAESTATSTVKGLRPGKPEVVKVDGLRITLTWAAPITAAANQSYDLQYGAHGRHEVTHKVVSGNRTTVDLKPTTRYTIRVKTSGSGADGRWSDVLRIRSNESRPGKAPSSVVITPQLPTLHVTWEPIPRDHHNGVLLGYVIFIKVYGTQNWKEHQTQHTRIRIEGLDTNQTYTVRVAGFTSEGHGPRSLSIHFDSDGLKTTPRPFKKTNVGSPVVSTRGPREGVTTKLVKAGDRESTRDTTIAGLRTTETTESEGAVARSRDELDEEEILKNVIVYGAPTLGCLVLLCCLLGCMLWRRKRHSQHQNLEKGAQLTRGSTKRKLVVTRGEKTITYCPPPEYKEKQPPVAIMPGVGPYSSHAKPLYGELLITESSDPEKQRIYESMDGLHAVLKAAELGEHRYVEADQLCVQLPAETQGHQRAPGKEPQYTNMAQSGHVYEAIPCEGQGPLYANAQAEGTKEDPYENNPGE